MSEPEVNSEAVSEVPDTAKPSAPKARKPEQHVTLFGAVLMQMITAAVCLSGAYYLDMRKGDETTVAIADTAAIVNAKLLSMQSKGLTPEDFNKQSAEFVKKMLMRLDEYKAAGVTVVNAQAVLVTPDGHDISKELAMHMGVNPNDLLQVVQRNPSESSVAQ